METKAKMILKGPDGGILVVNKGLQVTFQDATEFLFYTGIDLSNIVGLTYEPLRGFHTVHDGADDFQMPIPHEGYEECIGKIEELLLNKGNPYWGLEGEELQNMRVIQFENTLLEKMARLDAWYARKVHEAGGSVSLEKKNKQLCRQLKAMRKEAKGKASTKDIEFLDDMDAFDSFLDLLEEDRDNAEAWLKTPTRTIAEIADYDEKVAPNWTEA